MVLRICETDFSLRPRAVARLRGAAPARAARLPAAGRGGTCGAPVLRRRPASMSRFDDAAARAACRVHVARSTPASAASRARERRRLSRGPAPSASAVSMSRCAGGLATCAGGRAARPPAARVLLPRGCSAGPRPPSACSASPAAALRRGCSASRACARRRCVPVRGGRVRRRCKRGACLVRAGDRRDQLATGARLALADQLLAQHARCRARPAPSWPCRSRSRRARRLP